MKNDNRLSLILDVWRTNNRVTEFLFEHLPEPVWDLKIPGAPRRSVRMIAGHIHNTRCMWITMIGRTYGVRAPARVDRRTVTRVQLARALKQSSRGVAELLKLGNAEGGTLAMKMPYANIPPDVVHFMGYLLAHEAHHRGQIVLVAREAGQRLPRKLTSGLWQWTQRLRETRGKARTRRS